MIGGRELSERELEQVAGGAYKPAYIYYTAVEGDSLWDIAQQFNTTVEQIRRLNNLREGYEPLPGDCLVVPNN